MATSKYKKVDTTIAPYEPRVNETYWFIRPHIKLLPVPYKHQKPNLDNLKKLIYGNTNNA